MNWPEKRAELPNRITPNSPVKLIEIPEGTANRLLEGVMRAGATNEATYQALREAYAEGYRSGAAHVLAVRSEGLPTRAGGES